MRQRCFPHIEMFSFLHRECINLHQGRLRNKMHLHSTLKGCFLCVKRFWPIIRVKNNKTETRFCYMEDGWKVRMNICTALWSFVNFCCLSQSDVNTDNRKVNTFFAFQHVRCRCCYRSYLDRFLSSRVVFTFWPHPNWPVMSGHKSAGKLPSESGCRL